MFCRNCGIKLTDGSKYCSDCGTPVDTTPNHDTTTPVVFENNVFLNKEEKDIEDNKLMSVLAYLGLFVLIPIFAAKDSDFARFHSNQGLVLLISEFIVSLTYPILILFFYVALAFISGRLASLFFLFITLLFFIIAMVMFVFMILGIINALTGKKKPLPLIGKIKILK